MAGWGCRCLLERGLPVQDQILGLAFEVSRVTEEKVGTIDAVMRRSRTLALNARLEAARAGTAGDAFAVVANEMGQIALEISRLASELREAIATNSMKLESAGKQMLLDFHGVRSADLARTAVEIIDRNLYERSCDVRWWATDSAVVAALEHRSEASAGYTCDRLATILRSYTVYLDLWVADEHGRVIANGRPRDYPDAVGTDVSSEEWFRSAMATASGSDFHVCDIERSPALRGALSATYSTAVRAGAATHGRPIGALGIFFDWGPQAETVVRDIAEAEGDGRAIRVMLLNGKHRVIASSDSQGILSEVYPLAASGGERGYYQADDRLVAYAITPGYETYRGLSWYGCVERRT